MTDLLARISADVEAGRLAAAARAARVPYSTIKKWRSGKTRSPRLDTFERMVAYYEGRP